MEIISYVQEKPSSVRINLPVFFKRKEGKFDNFSIYNTELKSFSAKRITGPLNIKVFAMELGHYISDAGIIFAENSRHIFTVLTASALVIAAVYGIFSLNNYSQNFTGPVKIQKADEISIENLNKIMADFALEGKIDFDDSGKLVDSIQLPVQSYTKPVSYKTYRVASGDTISGIAKKFGLTNVSSLISVNDIGNVRQLAAGQKLKIPSIDGVIYTVKKGDSLNSIVEKNKISMKQLLDVNELSSEVLTAGQQLFLPGASLDSQALKTAMGDKFIMPISAKFKWSSPYGVRIDPIAGVKSFHTGTDMACPTGTPILAAMSGKVITTGINRVYGNYVIIDHGNGYQTLYAHMSKIIAAKGQWVSQGTRIGLVGSTGYSTGPHLHFTVYKNGKMINPMTILK